MLSYTHTNKNIHYGFNWKKFSLSPFIPSMFDFQENISNTEGMHYIEAVFH